MKMSEIANTALQPFWSAELDYRRERAQRSYSQRGFGKPAGGRRRWVPRRPSLKLPQQRRRPIAVA
jgi:hypothetical protein